MAPIEQYKVPIIHDTTVSRAPGQPAHDSPRDTPTRRSSSSASTSEEPFFVYLAHNLPHIPLYRRQGTCGHAAAAASSAT